MSGSRVVLATRSAPKQAEIEGLALTAGFTLVGLAAAGVPPDPAEDALESHETFEANALAKARWFAARLPGAVVLADDSGLEVPALGGAPGVRSKRWTGVPLTGAALDAANTAALLARLAGAEDRSARFRCAAACVWAGGELVRIGETWGRIVETPRGEGGFGYDPVFESSELGCTFGEASRVAKGRVSHRGRAFRALFVAMREGEVGLTVDVRDGRG
jgi:XTP/dITP diphosphohydrolase